MKLKELCELDVVCCKRELTIAAASRLMRERHVGDLVIVEDLDEEREPVGIITDRDIVVEILVDAAFLDTSDRELFRQLANRSSVPCFIVSCQADPITLAARVLERSARRRDSSDADLSVLDKQLSEIAPFETTELGCVIAVDTEDADAVKRVSDTIKQRIAN